MKGEKRHQTAIPISRLEILRSGFSRGGKNAQIVMQFRAVRDVETGETRFHVTIPGGEKVSFRHDMGVLLQTFGWGMATLAADLETAYGTDRAAVWFHCCDTVQLVEYHLRLDVQQD